jgi:hypothetical protein
LLPSGFFRVSAALLIAGAVLGIIASVISIPTVEVSPQEEVANPAFVPMNLMFMLGGLMVALGLPAAYARIARPGGALALFGLFALMATAVMTTFFFGSITLLILPWVVGLGLPEAAVAEGPPSFFPYFITTTLIALAGAVAFGVAVLRSGVISRWPGYLLLASAALNVVTFAIPEDSPIPVWVIAHIVSSLALAWLGYEVWRTAAEVRDLPSGRREDMAA